MTDNFPLPINNEKDLDLYEDYLNKEFSITSNPEKRLSNHMLSYIGHLLKIDCVIGTRYETRTGTLINVGEDFITLSLQNRNKIIIRLSAIKFITIMQGRTKSPYF